MEAPPINMLAVHRYFKSFFHLTKDEELYLRLTAFNIPEEEVCEIAMIEVKEAAQIKKTIQKKFNLQDWYSVIKLAFTNDYLNKKDYVLKATRQTALFYSGHIGEIENVHSKNAESTIGLILDEFLRTCTKENQKKIYLFQDEQVVLTYLERRILKSIQYRQPTRKKITNSLGISKKEYNNNIQSILLKLNCHNLFNAVRTALTLKILSEKDNAHITRNEHIKYYTQKVFKILMQDDMESIMRLRIYGALLDLQINIEYENIF